MRIKLVPSNKEKPAIQNVGDMADCLVVSLSSIPVEITKLLINHYQ